MMKRRLGIRGPEVSALGYGCMGLNSGYSGTIGRQDGVTLIRQAFDLSLIHI